MLSAGGAAAGPAAFAVLSGGSGVSPNRALISSGDLYISGPAAFAVLSGGSGGPPNGALISTVDRKTSGRATEHQAETGDPKSCPTTAATDRWPNARTRPSVSGPSLVVRHGEQPR